MPEDSQKPAATERQTQADFAQTFQEIARGERTATALENQLSSMEAKLDALLAEAERRQAEVTEAKDTQSEKPATNGAQNESQHSSEASA